MKQSTVKYFAIHEVVVLTGFSKHMLDYLAREDIFAPSSHAQGQRGVRRQYQYEDVVLLRALQAICSSKGKIRHLTKELGVYRKTFGRMLPGCRLDKLLVLQGDKLCTFDGGEGPRELVSGQMTLSFVVDLSAVASQVDKCVVIDSKSHQILRLTKAAAVKAEEERQRSWAPIKARREARA